VLARSAAISVGLEPFSSITWIPVSRGSK
jgi:hypothetical protein